MRAGVGNSAGELEVIASALGFDQRTANRLRTGPAPVAWSEEHTTVPVPGSEPELQRRTAERMKTEIGYAEYQRSTVVTVGAVVAVAPLKYELGAVIEHNVQQIAIANGH